MGGKVWKVGEKSFVSGREQLTLGEVRPFNLDSNCSCSDVWNSSPTTRPEGKCEVRLYFPGSCMPEINLLLVSSWNLRGLTRACGFFADLGRPGS